MSLLTSGCRVRIQDLPLLEDPHVCELTALQEIRADEYHLDRKEFANGRVRTPFYLLVRICDVEGAGKARISVYREGGQLLHESVFPFGEPGRYYSHIICYERHTSLVPGTYRVVVFLNGHLLDERPLRVFPADADSS
ncbi:MAG: hypothetical protein JXA62_08180 [Candidatus Aminicenantes bacterium]|nr:hypothetical protein [Candidatus Aminicenantes bacterium]